MPADNLLDIDDSTFGQQVRELQAGEELARLMARVASYKLVPGNRHTERPEAIETKQNLVSMTQTALKAATKHLSISSKHPDRMIQEVLAEEGNKEITYATFGLCLQQLAWKVQRVICVIASKGGAGKTPLITLLAALYAWLTKVSTLLIEGNENAGTVDRSTGVRRSDVNVLLTDAIENHELVNTHRKCGTNLGRHTQTGLNVLLSDSNNKNNQFTLQEFLDTFDTLREQHYATFGDTGNGMGITKAANTGLLLKSHVVLFPLVAYNYATYQPLLTTMLDMYNDGHFDKLQKYSRIVINATKEGYTIEHFLDVMLGHARDMTRGAKGEASSKEEWKDNPVRLLIDLGFDYDEVDKKFTGKGIFMVPYSQWIADDKAMSILPEDIGIDTLIAGLEILFECLTMPVQTDEEIQTEIDRILATAKADETEEKGGSKHASNLASSPQLTNKELLDRFVKLSTEDPTFLNKATQRVVNIEKEREQEQEQTQSAAVNH